jgi:fatty acid desaturase
MEKNRVKILSVKKNEIIVNVKKSTRKQFALPMLIIFAFISIGIINVGNFGWFWVFFPLILPVGVFLGILLLWIVIVIISTLLERRW